MPKSVLFDREVVLNNVTRLFWSKGYNGTSMQDLVDVTGLNRSSIYNSFGDKLELFREALSRYQQQQNDFTSQYINDTKSPKEALVSLFEGVKEDMMQDASRGCFLSNCTAEVGSLDPSVRDFLVDNKDRVVASFEKLIVQAQQTGEISSHKNADHLALYLFSSLQGLRVTGMIEQDQNALSQVAEQIIENI